ncbi:MAG TPA: ATP-binding cassette domain-containing protein, partial [bacterium]|nr:ATP-binding cassette domain-containing protein [bacterium]
MTAPILEVSGLAVRRGRVEVLRDINLDAWPGEVVALIGPNGAGKSTLLGAIAGVYAPTAGSVSIDGQPVTGLPAEVIVRRGLCLVPERRQVWSGLTVRQNLVLGAY